MVLNRKTIPLFVVFSAYSQSNRADAAVWWYEQAERLQQVSAALLDGPPISAPVQKNPYLEFRLLTSLLPKVNPKVGSKQEKVPAAPVHTVPTLAFGLPLASTGRYSLLTTAWAGYLPLPQSVAKTMGVNASLNQWIAGGSIENVFRLTKAQLTTSIGAQYGVANLEGAITAPGAQDAFNGKMMLIYLSQGVQGNRVPLWLNGMLLFRRGESKFNISAEKTEFIRKDTMSDATVPLAAQVTIGLTLKKSFHLAVSEYMIPNRLIMPRFSMVYQYALGKRSAEPESIPDTKRPTRKKSSRKKK